VGYSTLPGDASRATLFSASGPPQDLNSLIAPGTGYVLTYADEINDAGQIVGDALRTTFTRAMVLTPAPVTAVEQALAPARGFELRAPEPNPTYAGATLRYALPGAGRARLAVVDIAGREVIRLQDRAESAGEHVLAWDGRDSDGRPLKSGVYFVRMQARDVSRIQKLVVAR
jgi:hypothetical protein